MTTRQPETMILTASIEGIPTHLIGDEIFHESLAQEIHTEAEATVESSPCWLLELLGFAAAVDLVAAAMTAALHAVGDRYQAVDGVVYELVDRESPAAAAAVSLPYMSSRPVVTDASFETLPIGSGASRRAIAQWSDGTHSEVLRWHDDELLFSEGDLVGKTVGRSGRCTSGATVTGSNHDQPARPVPAAADRSARRRSHTSVGQGASGRPRRLGTGRARAAPAGHRGRVPHRRRGRRGRETEPANHSQPGSRTPSSLRCTLAGACGSCAATSTS